MRKTLRKANGWMLIKTIMVFIAPLVPCLVEGPEPFYWLWLYLPKKERANARFSLASM